MKSGEVNWSDRKEVASCCNSTYVQQSRAESRGVAGWPGLARPARHTLTVMISLPARSQRVQFGQPVCLCVCFTTGPAARPRLSPGLRKARCRFVNFHRNPHPHNCSSYVLCISRRSSCDYFLAVVASYSAVSSRSCRRTLSLLNSIIEKSRTHSNIILKAQLLVRLATAFPNRWVVWKLWSPCGKHSPETL